MTAYYEILFGLSVILTLIYIAIWHKHFDVHISLIFAFIPIVNLAYAMMAHSRNLDTALAAAKITYIGGCFLVLFISQSILSLCHINVKRWQSVLMTVICLGVYSFALSMGNAPYFYKTVSFEIDRGMGRLIKTYGIAHTLTYVIIALFVIINIVAMVYSLIRKNDVSNKNIALLSLPMTVSFISYFVSKFLPDGIDAMPFSYVFAQVIYLIIVHRLCLYDVTDLGIDSLIKKGDTGFISFDFDDKYLGSNESAQNIFPVLKEIRVDTYPGKQEIIKKTIFKWLEEFKRDETKDHFYYEVEDKIYLITIRYLYDGKHRRGYQFFITDDTDSRKYMKLLTNYNDQLSEEVKEKTANIVQMHNRLILGMATMVESRDNSTGGHIRRTSDVVKVLIDEIKKDEGSADGRKNIRLLFGKDGFTEEFCKNMIQAAPMHDLGKIAVDDAVLRKPGKFTDEEYAKMKKHAAEGARIVDSILEGTENESFHKVAVNVAHYHHERWDGSGYPEGLKGEEIPIEARIMAVADVYDALVSKRVYKDKFSFEDADRIMMESMGKHFDKRLERYYLSAKPVLEEYYRSMGDK
ncbi:MAG: HD domain-containing protein [Clostridiales bacterium]|nr:HD domain-containing protein [Clostridiales bacterium]